MLTGPAVLSDAPLTVDDWRIVHAAYYGFITVVRKVAQDAWARQDAVNHQPAPSPAPGRDGGGREGHHEQGGATDAEA